MFKNSAMKPARPTCIVCGSRDLEELVWIHLRGIAHGDPGHDVVHDYSGIIVCDTCGHGQLEEFSHDCWSPDEDWDMYWWYALDPDDVKQLCGLLDSCPNPLDPKCACAVHESLKQSSERVYGGVKHTRFAQQKTQYCRLSLKVSKGIPSFGIDRTRTAKKAA